MTEPLRNKPSTPLNSPTSDQGEESSAQDAKVSAVYKKTIVKELAEQSIGKEEYYTGFVEPVREVVLHRKHDLDKVIGVPGKLLLRVDTPQDRAAFEQQLLQDYPEAKICWISSVLQLENLLSNVHEERGVLNVSDGLASQVLFGGGFLVLDYDNFSGSMEHLNSLFDTPPRYGGKELHQNVKIIGLIGKEGIESGRYSSPFVSRWDQKCDLPHGETIAKVLSFTEGNDFDQVDFHGTLDFKEALLGDIVALGKGRWGFEPGALSKIKEDKPGLILKNAPWGNLQFERFISELLVTRKCSINGREYSLPEGFQLYRFDGYTEDEKERLQSKTVQIVASPEALDDQIVVCAANFDELFSLNVISDSGVPERKPGLLAQKNALFIAGPLTDGQWGRLLHSPYAINIKISAEVVLPEDYQKHYKLRKAHTFEPTPLNVLQEVPNGLVVETTDRTYATQKLRDQYGKALTFVDITSETDLSQLIESISFQQEDLALVFQRHPAILQKLMKERGRVICLRGLENNPHLRNQLTTLRHTPPYLVINGEIQTFEALIITLIEEKNFTDADHRLILSPSFNTICKELSISPSMCSFLKLLNKEDPLNYDKIKILNEILKQLPADVDLDAALLKAQSIHKWREDPKLYPFLKVQLRAVIDNPVKEVDRSKLLKILSDIDNHRELESKFWILSSCFSHAALIQIMGTIPTDNNKISLATQACLFDAILQIVSEDPKCQIESTILCSALGVDSRVVNITDIKIREERSQSQKWERLKTKCKTLLQRSPMLFLQGPPGAGKSFLARSILGSDIYGPINMGPTQRESDLIKQYVRDSDGHITEIDGPLKRWADDKSTGLKVLLIDEANLAKAGFWEIFSGLFDDPPHVRLGAEDVNLTPNHKVIFTGNPDNFPGRNKHRLLREVSYLSFKNFSPEFLSEKILDPQFNGWPEADKEVVIKQLLKIQLSLQRLFPYRAFGPRDLEEVAQRIHLFKKRQKKTTEEAVAYAAFEVYSGDMNPQERIAFQRYLSLRALDNYLQEKVQSLKSDLTITGSAVSLATTIFASLEVRGARMDGQLPSGYGKRAMLIEGPPGRGKDALLDTILSSEGWTESSYHVNAGNIEDLKQTIERAKKEGAILVISELNTLSSDILEGLLNDALTGTAKEGFFLFATVNSSDFQGRELMSEALKNRFQIVRIEDYTQEELETIGISKGLPEEQVKSLLSQHVRLQQQCQKRGCEVTPTSRDFFKACDSMRRGIEVTNAVEETYQYYQWRLAGSATPPPIAEAKLEDPFKASVEAFVKLCFKQPTAVVISEKAPWFGSLLQGKCIVPRDNPYDAIEVQALAKRWRRGLRYQSPKFCDEFISSLAAWELAQRKQQTISSAHSDLFEDILKNPTQLQTIYNQIEQQHLLEIQTPSPKPVLSSAPVSGAAAVAKVSSDWNSSLDIKPIIEGQSGQKTPSSMRAKKDDCFVEERRELIGNGEGYLCQVNIISTVSPLKKENTIEILSPQLLRTNPLVLPMPLGKIPQNVRIGDIPLDDSRISRNDYGNYELNLTDQERLNTLTCDVYGSDEVEAAPGITPLDRANFYLWPELEQVLDGLRSQSDSAKAVKALCDWLKHNTIYSLTQTTKEQYQRSDQQQWINKFLMIRAGCCSECARGFAYLVQSELSLPTRVAYGYMSKNGEVTKEDRHAWVEVYIRDQGWITFDSTAVNSDRVTELYLQGCGISQIHQAITLPPLTRANILAELLSVQSPSFTMQPGDPIQLQESTKKQILRNCVIPKMSVDLEANSCNGTLNLNRCIKGNSQCFDKTIITIDKEKKPIVVARDAGSESEWMSRPYTQKREEILTEYRMWEAFLASGYVIYYMSNKGLQQARNAKDIFSAQTEPAITQQTLQLHQLTTALVLDGQEIDRRVGSIITDNVDRSRALRLQFLKETKAILEPYCFIAYTDDPDELLEAICRGIKTIPLDVLGDLFFQCKAIPEVTIYQAILTRLIQNMDCTLKAESILSTAAKSGNFEIFKVALEAIRHGDFNVDQRNRVLYNAASSGNLEIFNVALGAIRHDDFDATYQRTMVLYNAVISGNLEIFNVALRAIRHDDFDVSQRIMVLYNAVNSGNFELYSAALEAIRHDDFDVSQRSSVLYNAASSGNHGRDDVGIGLGDLYATYQRNRVLYNAVSSGNLEIFNVALGAIRHDDFDVSQRSSVLYNAVSSGNLEIFNVALEAIRHGDFNVDQRNSVLCNAAKSGNLEIFNVALEAIRHDDFDANERMAVLRNAARSGNLEIFNVALGAIRHDDFDVSQRRSVLCDVANSGNFELYNAVLGAIRHNDFDVRQRIMVFYSAVNSGNFELYSAVLGAIRHDDFDVRQRSCVLCDAANSADFEMFKVALEAIQHDDFDANERNSVLCKAAESGNLELYNAALEAIQHDDFDANERNSVLCKAAESGNLELYNAALEAIRHEEPPIIVVKSEELKKRAEKLCIYHPIRSIVPL